MSSVRPEGAPHTFIWDSSRPVPWTCPYCNRPTTVTASDVETFLHVKGLSSSEGSRCVQGSLVVCPNTECKRTTLTLLLRDWVQGYSSNYPGQVLEVWQLMPDSAALSFDADVPAAIIDDYEEACRILNPSPKASAALARRCLQGMIRHFWAITRPTLKAEIEALKDKVDGPTWTAIDAVRSVGNIGAHMEKDVNIIIDVEPDEALKLIGLIELLIHEWYVRSQDGLRRVQDVIDLAKDKKALREQGESTPPTPHLGE